MTKRFGLLLVSLFITQVALASNADPVARCRWEISSNADGTVLGEDIGYLRLGEPSTLSLGPELPDLVLELYEVRFSPDTFGYRLKGGLAGYWGEKYFNPSTNRFGTQQYNGRINCEDPKEVPYYFVDEWSEVLILPENDSGEALIRYAVGKPRKYDSDEAVRTYFKRQNICLEGDPQAALKALSDRWSLGVENLTMTARGGLEWDWVKKTCVKYGEYDERGRDCLEWKVEIEGHTTVPPCTDDDKRIP